VTATPTKIVLVSCSLTVNEIAFERSIGGLTFDPVARVLFAFGYYDKGETRNGYSVCMRLGSLVAGYVHVFAIGLNCYTADAVSSLPVISKDKHVVNNGSAKVFSGYIYVSCVLHRMPKKVTIRAERVEQIQIAMLVGAVFVVQTRMCHENVPSSSAYKVADPQSLMKHIDRMSSNVEPLYKTAQVSHGFLDSQCSL